MRKVNGLARQFAQLFPLVCGGVFVRIRHARPRGKYRLSCLIFLASKGRFLTVCGERVNRVQPD